MVEDTNVTDFPVKLDFERYRAGPERAISLTDDLGLVRRSGPLNVLSGRIQPPRLIPGRGPIAVQGPRDRGGTCWACAGASTHRGA